MLGGITCLIHADHDVSDRCGGICEYYESSLIANGAVPVPELPMVRNHDMKYGRENAFIERLRGIVAANPRLEVPNFFLERTWRATSTFVLVYRDVDRTKNTVGIRGSSTKSAPSK